MQRELELFHEALEQDPADRAAFIATRHGGDPALVRRLLRLLAAHDRAERVDTTRNAPAAAPQQAKALDQVPERIGPYRVRERIGEGGMGVVYAAEQTAPFRRRVAIKVVRLGMDSQEVLTRFEAERQALVMLDHPGVAKALDAGVTDQGRPYFVMELVKGLALIEYCQKHRLALRDRLRLFVEVCAAIQHAHQKGIIHRDLKPSNILVAVQEGRPVPKVIDFGVAKATAFRLTERTLFTEQGRLIGTPEYMSPEQAEMSGLDVDTRTDVYSLGVILYQLLTGALPFDSRQLRAGGYSEILRIIREVQPPRPSTRLADLARSVEAARHEAAQQARQVRGELDWIVMRAMEKDRTRRYGTASALGEDVERYLTDRPVLAGPPSVAYSLKKLVKRHRVAAAFIAVVVLSAVVGITGLLAGLVRAREAEELASRRADNAQAAAGFLERMLFQADPEFVGGNPSLLEVMERAGSLIEAELRPFPEVEAAVRESLGVAYRRRSMFVEAAPHLWRSLEMRRRLFGEADLATARSYIALANLALEYEGDIADARALCEHAAECYRQHGLMDTTVGAWLQLDVGFVALAGDRLAAAERAFAACRRLLAADRGDDHPDVNRPIRGLAMVALLRGEREAAERLARQAVAQCAGGDDVYIGARAQLVLADVLLGAGPVEPGQIPPAAHDEAARLVETAGAHFVDKVGEQHIRIAECNAARSALALARGDFAAAARSARLCEEMRRRMLCEDHWAILEARLLRQRARIGLGGEDDLMHAELELAEIEEHVTRRLGPDHALTLQIVAARVDCAVARGDAAARAGRAARLADGRERRARRLRAGR